MGRGIAKTLFAAAGILTALSGLAGFGFADFVMSGGKRQTLAEARKWQEDHYDISWYDSLQKEEYIVEGFEGYALHTVLCKNPMKSGKYVILTHGYSDNRFGSLKYMKIYLDRGYNCIIYDLRGHGENEKTWTSYGVREGRDLVCLIKDTRERYDDVRVLGLHGESLGSATTVSALGYTQDVDFAVCDCVFTDLRTVLMGGFHNKMIGRALLRISSLCAKKRYGIGFSEMNPIDALQENKVPLLLIHGEKDTVIPPDNSVRMYEMTEGYRKIHLIPGASHANSVLTEPALYTKYVNSFLEDIGK